MLLFFPSSGASVFSVFHFSKNHCSLKTEQREIITHRCSGSCIFPSHLWKLSFQKSSSSPQPISIGQLHALLRFHLRPIYLLVWKGSYQLKAVGYLILRCASRLDAFSVYHIHTQLPSCALGRTTGAPEVCPSRSSRTKDSSSQISCAHDR